MALVWIDPNYFGSLCSNPNKIKTNDMVEGVMYFCLARKKFSQSTPTTGSNMFVPNKQNASGRKHTGPPNTDEVFDLESQWFCVNVCLLTCPALFDFLQDISDNCLLLSLTHCLTIKLDQPTYSCAHLRSTEESLTFEYDI